MSESGLGKMEHFYDKVPGWAAFAPLYRNVARTLRDDMVLVEVGSWLGKSAALMGVEIENSGTNAKLYCVDPWVDGGPDLRDTNHYRRVSGESLLSQFMRNVKPVSRHIVPIQKMSVDASRDFADNSVDFLMLDGDHSYEAVRDDIAAWLPKMRRAPGTMISGDDYGWPGVTQAVQEAFGDKAQVTWKKRDPNYLKSASYWWVML